VPSDRRRLFSIVVPVFENEANLATTVPRLLALTQRLPGYALELLFVEDGSRDRSFGILEEYAAAHPGVVKIVKLTRNFGQTPAVQAGLRHATGDCVGIISADLQEPCEMFADMIGEWERGARFVMGERQERRESQQHQLVSSIYWKLIRRFAFQDFPKLGYDFCLLDRQVVTDINGINEKNSSIFVLIYWLGYRPVRLPVIRDVRREGRSQWRTRAKIRFTIDTLLGFTYLPARSITFVGFALAVLSLLYLVYALGSWAVLRAAPPGWMTQVGLLTLLGSTITYALGVISEYLLRILDEARKRPPYVIERVIGGEADREV
jgi:dolichol-phosphate mannosyltransferase